MYRAPSFLVFSAEFYLVTLHSANSSPRTELGVNCKGLRGQVLQ